MIKEAIEKIIALAPANRLTIEAREYTDKSIAPVMAPLIDPLDVSTLSGFVDLVQNGFEAIEVEGSPVSNDDVLIHVVSHDKVVLLGKVSDQWGRRIRYAKAKLLETEAFPFGNFRDHESFIIGVQSMFSATDDDRDYVLKIASKLTQEKIATSDDDGVSQAVGVKQGVHLKGMEVLKPRVKLAPFRTFREVDQPISEFVFRAQQSGDGIPRLALFEADGGRWKLDAIENVARYIRAAITEIPVVS